MVCNLQFTVTVIRTFDGEHNPYFLSFFGTVFHCRKPDGTVACPAFHLVLVMSFGILHVQGSGMNHLLPRHATPLTLFLALAAPRDFTAGYCSSQWGRERGMITQTRACTHTHTHLYLESFKSEKALSGTEEKHNMYSTTC